ncbi:PLP-dependent aminotransferase family protein [Testudinibacter aquarius]|uniref:GntR family transcriptional regulator n=1 Tax=Testudinibacter aquarius TaxID=1524974 RepID=A0A4R3Y222_9PAST|nr:PLP-dependent aminotransferase family protein [Testudinibacter aquarius]KAE9527650.1 GntR family transcriptional regulator [Testudinibacter aquarius]TCV85730.1 GntR family transcriptional regulator [Testudinibacter aquarius]TNG93622.1 PLP-dependent aminotransferase family protein [Testudinibacter aquarius]
MMPTLQQNAFQHMAFALNKAEKEPLYSQLYQQIKQQISCGRLVYGEKLPSKRKIADYLNISQSTVENAYGQLLAEGYIEAKARCGFFVSFQAEQFALSNQATQPQTASKASQHFRYDFNPDQVDMAHFPFARMKKQVKKLWDQASRILSSQSEKPGEIVLREQIRDYLYASRGVSCSIDQIIIGAGVETCISQLILLFDHLYPEQCVNYAMEQYGYPMVAQLLRVFNKNLIRLPLTDENLKVDFQRLLQSAVNVFYVTPSHQYPYGSVLSINERLQLLQWANQQADRYIIEDDYDSEFRYKGKPIPALQQLDNLMTEQGKVIYLGSFSKLLMPSLRMTFMVLPQQLLPIYNRTCGLFNSTVPRLNQYLIAQFMQSGEFEKHIHRMRTHYRKKMELLCQLLQPYTNYIRYYGEQSGFYLLLDLYTETRSLAQLQTLAANVGIKLYPLPDSDKKYFSLGFGNLSQQQLQQAIPLLMHTWGYVDV